MIYLHDGHIRRLGVDWLQLIRLVEEIVRLEDQGACVHPLKPYLRFGDPANRIIAMPAYVGGELPMAGIKWIASFPGNIGQGKPRAHNTLVLNDPATGEPVAFLRSALLNGIRTAAVSGVMLRAYLNRLPLSKGLRLGIIGWGPVGRLHLEMCATLLGDQLRAVTLYDLRGIDPETIPAALRGRTEVATDWRSLYRTSDVIATCTASGRRYIDEPPPHGSLLLHVSLRDYEPAGLSGLKAIVVDDWQEVCRENTDIEQLHQQARLKASGVCTLADVVCRNALARWEPEETVLFAPMGLGIFDIAIAARYWREAMSHNEGVRLEHDA